MLRLPAHQRGFTAIELMVTLSVLAIMSAMAIPGFQDFMAENRARSKSIELMAALQTAQSEAKTRNRQVLFTFTNSPRPSAALEGHAGGTGWATVSLPLSGAVDLNRDVIQVGGAADSAGDVDVTANSVAVCFLPDGTLKNNPSTGITGATCTVDGANGINFLLEPSRGDKVWQVAISASGKISTCVGKITSSTFSCV